MGFFSAVFSNPGVENGEVVCFLMLLYRGLREDLDFSFWKIEKCSFEFLLQKKECFIQKFKRLLSKWNCIYFYLQDLQISHLSDPLCLFLF